ncbi:MAG TPA: XRE family transcriptional regulator [Desulfurella acetivorans]|nr:XRE family transcriptional regulator [Desulfurella acetivorans]
MKTAKQVLSYIRQYGLTLKEISELTGLSEGGLKKIASGQRKGSEVTLQKLERLHNDIKELKKIKPIKEKIKQKQSKKKKQKKKKVIKEKQTNERKKIMFKNVVFYVCLEKYYYKSDNVEDLAFLVISVNDFVLKCIEKIKKCKEDKYIIWGAIEGQAITLTRYFYKREFLNNVKSFTQEIIRNAKQLIMTFPRYEKRLSVIRLVLLAYEEKKEKKRK